MATFDFVADDDFRAGLVSDYAEMQKALEAESWKSVHVLAGSIVEAILVDYIAGSDFAKKQAIAFTLADMRIEVDAMRWLAWQAASRLEHGLDATREAQLARTYCARQAKDPQLADRFVTEAASDLMTARADVPQDYWFMSYARLLLSGASGPAVRPRDPRAADERRGRPDNESRGRGDECGCDSMNCASRVRSPPVTRVTVAQR